jgi:hypothetical protein
MLSVCIRGLSESIHAFLTGGECDEAAQQNAEFFNRFKTVLPDAVKA